MLNEQKILLKPGDIFLTVNPMWLGKAINFIQRFWSKDNNSIYSHAGIILNKKGKSFEALWRVSSQNIFDAYKDKQILIVRHNNMDLSVFKKGLKGILHHNKDFYPFYRLIFHLFPPLAKLSLGKVVCSELTAKFLYKAGLFDYYNGCNPDDLYDAVRHYKGWKIVFEGIL